MKKFIQNIIAFFAGCAAFYLCALMIWGFFLPADLKKNLNYKLGSPGFAFTRLHEADKSTKVDIVFLGSSHAYRGFDPRIFKEYGFSSFNLGSSAQTPLQTEALVDEYIAKLKPATVFFEVYPFTFSSDGVESSLDIIAAKKINTGTVKMTAAVNNIKTYNSLLFGFFRQLSGRDKSFKEKLVKPSASASTIDTMSYVKGGFVEVKRMRGIKDSTDRPVAVASKDLNESGIEADVQVIQNRKGEWTPNHKQLKAFESILKKLKQQNIRVVLVQAPVNSHYYRMIKCSNEIDTYFASKGEYYNFNNLMQFDDDLNFIDFDHLNQAGVRIFNMDLIKRVFDK